MSDTKPLPKITHDGREYWAQAAQDRLVLQQCEACGAIQFYPRIVCATCLSTALDWRQAGGGGTVHAFTIVHRAPTDAFRADVPYVVAIVELDEGPRMMANIVGCALEKVAIGARVAVTFEPRGDAAKIPQFRLDT